MKKKLVLVTFVLGVPALWAADGVIEINQATVEANGGFPYVISEPGSYKLTGHLSVLNTTAIEVRADDVTLDLNGFAIGCGGLFDPDDPCELGNRGEGVTAFFVSGENSDLAIPWCATERSVKWVFTESTSIPVLWNASKRWKMGALGSSSEQGRSRIAWHAPMAQRESRYRKV